MAQDEKLPDELPELLDKVVAGKDVYQPLLKQYDEQLDRLREYAEKLDKMADEPVVREQQMPETKPAPRSDPATMKLTQLWNSTDLRSPGNIVVIAGKDGKPHLAVVENWRSVAEVGLDGKLIALHKLDIDEKEAVGNLRTAVGADGRRYTVAWMISQQRCHVLDDNWNVVASYPENALENPHSGMADVELGDLDGDGKLKIYIGYWGVVGVQAASLEGKRLWSNRSLAHVLGMAIGAADDKGRRNLYCTNSNGSVVVLDDQGQRQGDITIPKRMLHWIVTADLRNDKKPLWCGLAVQKIGEEVAVGFSLDGRELWHYALPPGAQTKPIEPIIVGRLSRDGPGQWILPGPDGSIHVLAADGTLVDKFNTGVALQGLATVEIDGQPVLITASEKALTAWKVEK